MTSTLLLALMVVLTLVERGSPRGTGCYVIRTRGLPDGFDPPSASLDRQRGGDS